MNGNGRMLHVRPRCVETDNEGTFFSCDSRDAGDSVKRQNAFKSRACVRLFSIRCFRFACAIRHINERHDESDSEIYCAFSFFPREKVCNARDTYYIADAECDFVDALDFRNVVGISVMSSARRSYTKNVNLNL